MSFKIIPKNRMPEWIDWICEQYQVMGPKPVHGQHVFGTIKSFKDIDLEYPTTVIPPKKYFLPMKEDLFHFDFGKGKQLQVSHDYPMTVILGVHTCDLHAIKLLDKVFASDYADQHYNLRRENTILVSIECLKPCNSHSFCKDMGTSTITDGYDLHLTDLGDAYSVDVGTLRGAKLVDGFDYAREGADEDISRVNQVMSDKWPLFPMRLEFDINELPSILDTSYDSTLWEELGERCLGCGSCTNVCPTCYCFDMRDEVDLSLQAGTRFRVVDSCQLDEFAEVAGGHNFRRTRADRQRHRFFRKGKYIMDTHSLLGCVGCGRCGQQCLVHINPVDTYNELHRRRHAADVAVAGQERRT